MIDMILWPLSNDGPRSFLAKIREVSYPIPVELPVTIATFWSDEEEVEVEDVIYYPFGYYF